MKKWLVIGGVVLIALLVFMWRETTKSQADDAAPVVNEQPAPVVVAAAPTGPVAKLPGQKPTPEEEAPVVVEGDKPPVEKYDPQSDEFFFKHDEIVVPQVMRSAVKCWENLTPEKRASFHRNQSMVITFKQKIVNGKVTMQDAQIERSSWKDPAIEACFFKQVLATTWSDERLPDWEQEDRVKISPRVLKKYTQENINYVGPEEPKVPRMITGDELKKDFDPNYKE
jgi:hypothetical protein